LTGTDLIPRIDFNVWLLAEFTCGGRLNFSFHTTKVKINLDLIVRRKLQVIDIAR